MPVLIYDTETTGLYNFKASSNDPSQPHIVQLAGKLMADDGERVLGSINFIINNEVEIPKEASNVHGITTDTAKIYGVSPRLALYGFAALSTRATRYVAHNINFDKKIIATAYARFDMPSPFDYDVADEFCTMNAGSRHTKIPPTQAMVRAGRGGGYKPPKLIELYKHLFGAGFEGAHDAMVDVDACAKCYFELERLRNAANVEI